MNKADFLTWYFSGSDQEQREILISLGQRVKESLVENNESFINVETLMSECIEVYQEENK
jgi:hypothetical protein